MGKFKLIYQVPSALGLSAISGISGFLAAVDIMHPGAPVMIFPWQLSGSISVASGVGAATLWKEIIKELANENSNISSN